MIMVAVPKSSGIPSSSIPLGVYAGPANPSGINSFASVTGTAPTYASDYLPGSSGWIGMDGQGGSLKWLTSAWAGTGYKLVLGVPIIPTDSSGDPEGSLAGGAAGDYDSYYTTLAQTLISAGLSGTYLRLGWEFNGNWYPWRVTDSTDASNFVAYWQNIVSVMRSVPGANFKFVWNPNVSGSYGSSYTPLQTYPGNSYVNFIGTDVYDQCWCSPQTPQNAWSSLLSQGWGLNWLASFAASQGKPVVFSEWGLAIRSDGHGLGDDPYFINQMAAWFVTNKVAWVNYLNHDSSGQFDAITDGYFPNAIAAFKTDFG
jgi:hypothetical protein